ncbi:dual specificity protein phosphatase 1B [Selaginella moellendorffii]|uniref:dual specificity protein phosphatase 1B n=1 Tax=Selaginella moellendorffii TaxID=88036 RepID=UPI000D1C7595|nr:dual specificity protein phosphatase 1B [Selaginella moellendorffii]|eukprot:XP_024536851.1 dual specificity protein phosphatase 1B [Selaginella moellendorffii]
MKKVRPGLYIGNQFDAFYFLTGKHRGVTHILSVVPLCPGHEFSTPLGPPRDNAILYKIAAELDTKRAEFDGAIVRKVIPVEDSHDENLLEHLEDALKFIDEGVNKGIVLVHCGGGISRSASVVIAYLMWKEKLSASEALASLRKCSPTVKPNSGFMKQLQVFESSGCVVRVHGKKEHKRRTKAMKTCRICNRVAPSEEFLICP